MGFLEVWEGCMDISGSIRVFQEVLGGYMMFLRMSSGFMGVSGEPSESSSKPFELPSLK